MGADGSAIDAVSHGTTVATNQLLEGKVDRLGFVTTEGYEAMLEIARQSVPDGYGNSYFWVKPDRIVPRDLVKGVGGPARLHRRRGAAVRRGRRPRGRPLVPRRRASTPWASASCTPTPTPSTRSGCGPCSPRSTRTRWCRCRSEVLREYREYERAMTTLVDAAVKPRLSAYVNNIKSRLDRVPAGDDRAIPFYVMKSNGGVLSADEVVHQPITTVLSGPAAGALGAALIAKVAGFDRVLTSDGGGTSTDVSVVIDGEPTLTTEGSVGAFPSKIPMIDVVTVGAGGGSIAWLSPEGTLKVGPQSAGADPGPLCYAKGGTDVTITDAHVVPRPDPAAPARRRDPARRAGREGRRRAARLEARAQPGGVRHRHPRDLRVEPGQRAAPGHRQARPRRPRLHPVTFGGSGSLLLCRLMDVLGMPTVLVPPNPGNVSAFGLLTVDVKNDYVQTHVSLADNLDAASVAGDLRRLTGQAAAALTKEGFARASTRSCAPPTCATSARRSRCGSAYRTVRSTPACWTRWRAGSMPSTRRSTATTSPVTTRQQVEWVNLRVSGIGPIQRPEIRRHDVAVLETAPARLPQPPRARGLLRGRGGVRRHARSSGARSSRRGRASPGR